MAKAVRVRVSPVAPDNKKKDAQSILFLYLKPKANYLAATGFFAAGFLAAGFLAAAGFFAAAGLAAVGFFAAGFLATGFLAAAGFFAAAGADDATGALAAGAAGFAAGAGVDPKSLPIRLPINLNIVDPLIL